MQNKKQNKTIVLAYSGGLDTSVMVHWLAHTYECEIVALLCDVGQGAEIESARTRAYAAGAQKLIVVDVKKQFVEQYLWPLVRAGALYENRYVLGTISRPLIAQELVKAAAQENAYAVSHGATGKGNDQVRFELAIYALNPHLQVIAPWRIWDITSRTGAIAYAHEHGISVPVTTQRPYSTDSNLWYVSHEGGILEDPACPHPEDIYLITQPLAATPEKPDQVTIDFLEGIPVGLNGKIYEPVALLEELTQLGGLHGVGIVDMVENRVVGMKCRCVYESPAATILHVAHEALESICLDRATSQIKAGVAQQYAQLVYEGRWFTPLRQAYDAFIAQTQKPVTGSVCMRLHKGHAVAIKRESRYSLFDKQFATFEHDVVYDQKDAAGFIKLFGLPVRVQALMQERLTHHEK